MPTSALLFAPCRPEPLVTGVEEPQAALGERSEKDACITPESLHVSHRGRKSLTFVSSGFVFRV